MKDETIIRPSKDSEVRKAILSYIESELDRGYRMHGWKQWGRHEFYAIMREEVDEVWDNIKANGPSDELIKEVVQIAAVCIRFLETGIRPHIINK